MRKLIRIEFIKLRKLKSLRAIFLIYAIVSPLALYAVSTFIGNFMGPMLPKGWSALQFPNVWAVATYSSSYLNILMGVLAIIVITNEYRYKTLRQHVIDGLSLQQAVLAKFFVVMFFSFIVSLYTGLVAIVFGVVNSVHDLPFYRDIHHLGLYFLQTMCYFSFAFMIASWIKRTAISVIVFILSFLVESIIGISVKIGGFQEAYAYMPLNSFSKLTPFPILKNIVEAGQQRSGFVPIVLDTPINILLCLGWMILFYLLSYFVIHDRDL